MYRVILTVLISLTISMVSAAEQLVFERDLRVEELGKVSSELPDTLWDINVCRVTDPVGRLPYAGERVYFTCDPEVIIWINPDTGGASFYSRQTLFFYLHAFADANWIDESGDGHPTKATWDRLTRRGSFQTSRPGTYIVDFFAQGPTGIDHRGSSSRVSLQVQVDSPKRHNLTLEVQEGVPALDTTRNYAPHPVFGRIETQELVGREGGSVHVISAWVGEEWIIKPIGFSGAGFSGCYALRVTNQQGVTWLHPSSKISLRDRGIVHVRGVLLPNSHHFACLFPKTRQVSVP